MENTVILGRHRSGRTTFLLNFIKNKELRALKLVFDSDGALSKAIKRNKLTSRAHIVNTIQDVAPIITKLDSEFLQGLHPFAYESSNSLEIFSNLSLGAKVPNTHNKFILIVDNLSIRDSKSMSFVNDMFLQYGDRLILLATHNLFEDSLEKYNLEVLSVLECRFDIEHFFSMIRSDSIQDYTVSIRNSKKDTLSVTMDMHQMLLEFM